MTNTLEELTFESTSRTVIVDGHRMHYNEAGIGTPIVLLHGGGPGASGWSNFHQNLSRLAKTYRVLLVDQPGYGNSTKTPPVDECRSEMAMRLLVGLLDELNIDRTHLLGNSFGGRTAIQTALRHPDRVDNLVLMGPAGGSLNIFAPEPTEGMKHLHGFFAEPGPSMEKMQSLVDTFLYDRSLSTPELVRSRYEAAVHPDTRAFYTKFLSTPDAREPELWRDLGRIPHRTLLMWGRDDRTNPYEGGLFMLKRMPNAQLHVFPQCGHWVQFEQAQEFERVLGAFLETT
ncbi:alpha/beta fold hydrolase [Nocardioides carbamazepini]|uniref:alpha/beta fold hydrolase n=1 Tax=Nocardioides carbamazepini TaxID=2854259 RepID=UPI00214A0378|nr:alpha/beta fold hydrolase [Nocardioides carbamazepini]MCR1784993.1 alpha/beta fold hydrolase [Nocardioides carbamazepini]